MDNHECMLDEYADFGFIWCGIRVRRATNGPGSHVIQILVNNKTLNVHVSPTGRSVRAYLNGKELK